MLAGVARMHSVSTAVRKPGQVTVTAPPPGLWGRGWGAPQAGRAGRAAAGGEFPVVAGGGAPGTGATRLVGGNLPIDGQTDVSAVVDAAQQVPCTPGRPDHDGILPPCHGRADGD